LRVLPIAAAAPALFGGAVAAGIGIALDPLVLVRGFPATHAGDWLTLFRGGVLRLVLLALLKADTAPNPAVEEEEEVNVPVLALVPPPIRESSRELATFVPEPAPLVPAPKPALEPAPALVALVALEPQPNPERAGEEEEREKEEGEGEAALRAVGARTPLGAPRGAPAKEGTEEEGSAPAGETEKEEEEEEEVEEAEEDASRRMV
jgi:hypothetical protein